MTATNIFSASQTVKVYIARFDGCTTRAGFFVRLARAFSLDAACVISGGFWQAVCERVSALSQHPSPVVVRLHGLDAAFAHVPKECEQLIRVLRAASAASEHFCAEAIIGEMKWRIE